MRRVRKSWEWPGQHPCVAVSEGRDFCTAHREQSQIHLCTGPCSNSCGGKRVGEIGTGDPRDHYLRVEFLQ